MRQTGRIEMIIDSDAGYRQLKLHEVELAAVRPAREEAGADVDIILDVNCAWDLASAKVHLDALRETGLRWIEEAVWPPENFEALAELRRTADVPIAAGENVSTLIEFDRIMAAGAVDIIQPSPAKMGGLTELVKVATLTAVRNAELMIHNFYDGPGLLAAIHATAALGASDAMVEWRRFDLEAQLYGPALNPVNGSLAMPENPGLGFEPDRNVIRDHSINGL